MGLSRPNLCLRSCIISSVASLPNIIVAGSEGTSVIIKNIKLTDNKNVGKTTISLLATNAYLLAITLPRDRLIISLLKIKIKREKFRRGRSLFYVPGLTKSFLLGCPRPEGLPRSYGHSWRRHEETLHCKGERLADPPSILFESVR